MKNWIPKKSLVIISSAFSVGFFLVYLISSIYVFWQIDKIENYYSDTESRSGREERARAIRLFSETNKEQINAVRSFFIKEGEEANFIENVEAAANKAGVKFDIAEINIQNSEGQTLKENVEVNVKLEGGWGAVMSFLDSLEKMPFGTYVYDFSLDKENGIWSGAVNFLVFREKNI